MTQDVSNQSSNEIDWPAWGAGLRAVAEIYAGADFRVIVTAPDQVREWKKHLGLQGDAVEAVPIVVTLAIITAVVAIALIATFAAVILVAINRGYDVEAELDVEKKTISFNFVKREAVSVAF